MNTRETRTSKKKKKKKEKTKQGFDCFDDLPLLVCKAAIKRGSIAHPLCYLVVGGVYPLRSPFLPSPGLFTKEYITGFVASPDLAPD
jgi:hypothetical protein